MGQMDLCVLTREVILEVLLEPALDQSPVQAAEFLRSSHRSSIPPLPTQLRRSEIFIDTNAKKTRLAPLGATYGKTFFYTGSAQNQMPLLTALNAFCWIEAIKISLLRSCVGRGGMDDR